MNTQSPRRRDASTARGTRFDADGKRRYNATGPAPSAPASSQLSALPSPFARGLAFASILFGGLLGGLIGFGVMKATDPRSSATAKALSASVGAIVVALGTAVLAVLVMRAMGEWRRMNTNASRVRLGDG